MPGTRGAVPLPVTTNSSQPRDLTKEILFLLDTKPQLHTADDFPDVSQAEIKAALDRLASRQMIQYDTKDAEKVILTGEGQMICDEGSHEFKVWDAVKRKGRIGIKDLPNEVGLESAKIGQGNAFKLKWIKKDGDALVLLANTVQDKTRESLQEVHDTQSLENAAALKDFTKRKLVKIAKVITYTVQKGPKYATEIPIEVTDLTADMLANGEWKTANFKPYNFQALGASQNAGALHPLNKVRAEFRQLFFNLGFVEMPTSRYVESGFWNFDALFVPQQHPARDMQDTFFISDPPSADPPRPDPDAEAAMDTMEAPSKRLFAPASAPASTSDPATTTALTNTSSITPSSPQDTRDYTRYWNSTRAVHKSGAFGSIGYRYPWSPAECLRLVLRTHTTAVSTWCLHRLASNPRPVRYFSIDRVFRNETVDATHLAEFHQVEGVIADFGLTLGGLMRFLEEFFGNLGISGLRFKPAYNPYTEPSMEVFGWHAGLGKWVEIGNSGMFRPEMLEPMGLPPDLRVYGFGLSLERPTMIKYGVSNIRELLGHKVDLGFIETNAAVRLEKD
ncbi:MAG: Phenylalanyl-tRNA synthetase, beta subunit, cytoplasmic [Bathelium mastoideum]|nr:MAG: Phenylalanyl-tRNA synthetase, beta subunit, cytoplasmic [Bathelium mastoideum]